MVLLCIVGSLRPVLNIYEFQVLFVCNRCFRFEMSCRRHVRALDSMRRSVVAVLSRICSIVATVVFFPVFSIVEAVRVILQVVNRSVTTEHVHRLQFIFTNKDGSEVGDCSSCTHRKIRLQECFTRNSSGTPIFHAAKKLLTFVHSVTNLILVRTVLGKNAIKSRSEAVKEISSNHCPSEKNKTSVSRRRLCFDKEETFHGKKFCGLSLADDHLEESATDFKILMPQEIRPINYDAVLPPEKLGKNGEPLLKNDVFWQDQSTESCDDLLIPEIDFSAEYASSESHDEIKLEQIFDDELVPSALLSKSTRRLIMTGEYTYLESSEFPIYENLDNINVRENSIPQPKVQKASSDHVGVSSFIADNSTTNTSKIATVMDNSQEANSFGAMVSIFPPRDEHISSAEELFTETLGVKITVKDPIFEEEKPTSSWISHINKAGRTLISMDKMPY